MKDSGYAGLYSPKGMTTGLMSGIFGNLPENIIQQGSLQYMTVPDLFLMWKN